MDENLKLLATIIGAGGAGTFLTMMFKGIGKLWSGAAQREQARNTSLVTQRTDAIAERIAAEKERDIADDRRREAEENIAKLERQLILEGLVPITQIESK
jgi:hypothetical protein